MFLMTCNHCRTFDVQVALSVAASPSDSKKMGGEVVSLEMEELQRAYAQCGHLSTTAGHALKQNPDLYLHNSGAW